MLLTHSEARSGRTGYLRRSVKTPGVPPGRTLTIARMGMQQNGVAVWRCMVKDDLLYPVLLFEYSGSAMQCIGLLEKLRI